MALDFGGSGLGGAARALGGLGWSGRSWVGQEGGENTSGWARGGGEEMVSCRECSSLGGCGCC